jgi:hypothetical protein
LAWPALPAWPTTELMLMMRPPRCFTIGLSTDCTQLKAAVRLVAMT